MLCIIDYGSGNVAAIANICRKEKIPYCIANQPDELEQGTHFLLPGVGAFDATMERLKSSDFLGVLEKKVMVENMPLLGICIGMQLLADCSEEGEHLGLGWISGQVKRIDVSKLTRPPHLPHMGWNSLDVRFSHEVLSGIDTTRGFYFLHSYYFDAADSADVVATVHFGADLPCLVRKGNIIGAQFHPEKSHSNGIRLIANFARLNRC